MEAVNGSGRPHLGEIVLAHADPVMRRGARLALEEHGFRVTADAATTVEAVRLVRALRPVACVIDTRLPGAMAGIRAIAQTVPGCATVALGAGDGHAEVVAALRSGASGYLRTDIDPPLLPQAVRAILAGETVMPAATAGWMIAALDDGRLDDEEDEDDSHRLTERHWQVLALLQRDLSTAQIAAELGVSPITVRRHRSEIRVRAPRFAGARGVGHPPGSVNGERSGHAP